MTQRRTWAALLSMVLAVALSGCDSWRQVGFGSTGQHWNPFERQITSANAAQLSERWSSRFGGAGHQAIVDDGKVFVAYDGAAGGVTAAALRASDGAPLWQRATGASGTAGQPVLMGRQLYGTWRSSSSTSQCTAGEYRLDARTGAVLDLADTTPISYGTAVPTGGRFVQVATTLPDTGCPDFPYPPQAVVVRDRASGAPVWRSATLESVRGVPVVGDGRVYVAHRAGVSAYDLAGCGGASECGPLWTFAIPDLWRAPLFAEGRVFVARSGSGINLAAIDAVTGEPVWVTTTEHRGKIAYARGNVYLAGSGTLEAYRARGCGRLLCSPTWTANTSFGPNDASVIAGGDVVYVTQLMGHLSEVSRTFAFDVEGCETPPCAPLWSSDIILSSIAEMAVAEGQLYLTDRNGPLRALAASP